MSSLCIHSEFALPQVMRPIAAKRCAFLEGQDDIEVPASQPKRTRHELIHPGLLYTATLVDTTLGPDWPAYS